MIRKVGTVALELFLAIGAMVVMAAAPAVAGPLPFADGRYVVEPELCFLSDEEMSFAFGDRVGTFTRIIEGKQLADGYEMSCVVSNVIESASKVSFTASCSSEGEVNTIEGDYTKVSENAFRVYGRLFRRCGSDAAISEYTDGLDADTGELVSAWDDANSRCRGGSGNEPKTLAACGERDSYDVMLAGRQWCYGENAQAGYQAFWAPCAKLLD